MTITDKRETQEVPLTAHSGSFANSAFTGLSTFAASLILVLLAAVATFLIVEAWPAMTQGGAVLADNVSWIKPEAGESLIQVIGYLVFGTVLVSAIALLIATPLSIGIALFISHYAPRRLAAGLGYLIDLLAAIPSVVYGLWGSIVLIPVLQPFYQWLGSTFGWIPLLTPNPLTGEVSPTGRVALSASCLLYTSPSPRD